MKLIIDIPKHIYDCVIGKTVLLSHMDGMCKAIEEGTPLPKGHGRLIDADEIQFENTEFDTYNDYCIAFDAIDQADTIIEADKLPNNELENPFNDGRFGG